MRLTRRSFFSILGGAAAAILWPRRRAEASFSIESTPYDSPTGNPFKVAGEGDEGPPDYRVCALGIAMARIGRGERVFTSSRGHLWPEDLHHGDTAIYLGRARETLHAGDLCWIDAPTVGGDYEILRFKTKQAAAPGGRIRLT